MRTLPIQRGDPRPGPPVDAAGGVVCLVDDLLREAIIRRATDLHFEPADDGLTVRARIDAELHAVEHVPPDLCGNVVARLKVLAGLLTYRTDIPQEGALTLDEGSPVAQDVRISTIPTIRGERVVLRFLARQPDILSLESLGLSDELLAALRGTASGGGGLILVTGPAGSGKTTTLYSLVHWLIGRPHAGCIVTVEDPVEYRVDGIAQIQVQPSRGLTYARVLRSVLRQDPETLLVGEIRDAETAHVAAEASLTGHLVLSTMHAGGAGEALLRLLEMGVPAYQITSGVRLIVMQRLLRRLCESCRRPTGDPEGPYAAAGCDRCLHTGYAGRIACGAIARMTPRLREVLLRHGDAAALSAAVDAEGPADLARDAERHVRDGWTTRPDVRRISG